MGRILAIDYGRKRTGLAVTDPLKMIAGGLVTLPGNQVVGFIKKYIEKEEIDLFLLGEPRQMNYLPSENMQWVEQFRRLLEKAFPYIPVQYVDERFTSVLAKDAMLQGGLKKMQRRNKSLVDELSATILLQTYLESVKYNL